MEEIISFNARQKGSLSRVYKSSASDLPRLNSSPPPNFQDPHSGFFPEPTFSKIQCDFLPYSDEQILIRFGTRNGLQMEIGDNREITFSKRVDFSHSETNIRSLFSHKPTIIEVLKIQCPDPQTSDRTFKSMLCVTGEEAKAASLTSLMHIVNSQIASPKLDLPEIHH